MKIIKCLNLCDLYISSTESIKDYERVYVGSYFCPNFFLKLTENQLKKVNELSSQIKVTLVIPAFTEKNLDEGKEKIDLILSKYGDLIDEITVNDYGMLLYISKKHTTNLNIGRLMVKDYRDPRYPKYFNEPHKPKIFNNYLKELLKVYKITGIEFDPTHKILDFSNKPGNIIIGIHAPFSYITMGRICEYASAGKGIETKFRPNTECGTECTKTYIKYDFNDKSWIRIGKAIYFKNEDIELIKLNEYREIYFNADGGM